MRAASTSSVMAACVLACFLCAAPQGAAAPGDAAVRLPDGVEAVWGLDTAYRRATKTRERICMNGLWRWQPARADADAVPEGGWGYFKVPGCWPGVTDYMQKDCQTVYAHRGWKDRRLGGVTAAWYQRETTVPPGWTGRRIVLEADYVNSWAAVYVDGHKAGELRFPGGEVDLTSACRPGRKHVLAMLVVAMPLEGVMLSYGDTASARKVKGRVARRGLCGDVYLSGEPRGPRTGDVKVTTSVRKGSIRLDVALAGLADDSSYVLKADVMDGEHTVHQFTSRPFRGADLKDGRITVTEPWRPEKLWDVHTPQNMLELRVSLLGAGGQVLDAALPVRFGFRELWIDGRDFYLNGTRIFLSSVPLDNAQVGAAWANYDAARESMERLKGFGINFVYAHNYGCQPGDHLGFEEVLRAADDVAMLVAFSQPHFGHYDWDRPDADRTNGYARHAAFYVRAAENHPSVVAYATSHNATGYAEDMNPDMIDGIHARRSEWAARNVERARRVEAIIRGLDPSRIVYHHASGNLGSMHTINFYANFVPIQEMSDWFEHWATEGVKPLFTCEYSVPMPWDWAMYRGWYRGHREFGSAAVPWEFCLAEWNAQFLGDAAYRVSNQDKENLRWEAGQFRAGKVWHRWDYPHPVGSSDFAERYPVYAMYFSDNWPAFRTWGVSANSPWDHGHYWTLRAGVDKRRKDLKVDWRRLQRPGFSPDYVDERYERMDLAYERSDWVPTVAARALVRTNGPLLALRGRQAGGLHQQGPYLLSGRNDREAGHRHQQLAGDRDVRYRPFVWPPPARRQHRRETHRGNGPAEAHSVALRSAGHACARGIRTEHLSRVQHGRAAEGFRHRPCPAAPTRPETGREDRPVRSQRRNRQAARRHGRPLPESRRGGRPGGVRSARGGQGRADGRRAGAGRAARARRPEGARLRANARRAREPAGVPRGHLWAPARIQAGARPSGPGRPRRRAPAQLARAVDDRSAPLRVHARSQVQLRADGPLVRHPGQPALAVRLPRQCRLRADRETAARRLSAHPRRRLRPPVQPVAGVPRGKGNGAFLPDGRDRPHRGRPRGRDARPQHAGLRLRLETVPPAQGRLRGRPCRKASPRAGGHLPQPLRGRQAGRRRGPRGRARRGANALRRRRRHRRLARGGRPRACPRARPAGGRGLSADEGRDGEQGARRDLVRAVRRRLAALGRGPGRRPQSGPAPAPAGARSGRRRRRRAGKTPGRQRGLLPVAAAVLLSPGPRAWPPATSP